MVFLSGIKLMPKSISHLGGISGRSLGKTSRNSLTMGTDSMEGISESRSWTLTIWYIQPLRDHFACFRQDIIQPLGIEFAPPPSSLQRIHLES